MSNLLLTMELDIYHMKQNKKCIHRFNVSHCKCTNMNFEKWTSIADGYVSCIHNSWELESPLIDSWKIFNTWLYLGVAVLGLHAQTAARTCGRVHEIPGDLILPNEQFVVYYGIRHIISHETKLLRSAYTGSV